MPISNVHHTLSNTVSKKICESDNMPHDVILHNSSKSSNNFIYVGGGSATAGTATGIHIDNGETLYFTLQPNDEPWARSDPNGLVVHVMDIRKED